MIEDRILKIVSTIVRLIVTAESREIIEEDLMRKLAEDGYGLDEIQSAFKMLSRVVENLKSEARTHFETPDARARRVLTGMETVRMSEDAISLFQNWQSLNLMTMSESEDILRQVLQSHAGDVEADDLLQFAENAAIKGSTLSLYLSAHNATLQ
ncbi:MAG: DUF494 family protein [Candidatus Hydrogenedentota bacterium]